VRVGKSSADTSTCRCPSVRATVVRADRVPCVEILRGFTSCPVKSHFGYTAPATITQSVRSHLKSGFSVSSAGWISLRLVGMCRATTSTMPPCHQASWRCGILEETVRRPLCLGGRAPRVAVVHPRTVRRVQPASTEPASYRMTSSSRPLLFARLQGGERPETGFLRRRPAAPRGFAHGVAAV
jgi:hypothetical protein